ncbi:MAG: DMT family transporter [Bacteroidales bacterium]|nr:DMT family transporter [Bacteroidales bacterium]MDD3989268.1 DMT family transporter [Bacteroidales bacterium]
MKNQSKALLAGFTVVLFWSTVATSFKIALQEMGYIQLLLIASITALVITAIFAISTGKLPVIKALFSSPVELKKLALQSLLNPFLYYLVLFKAYSLLPAQIAQPLNYTWQVILILMMAVLLKQRLKIIQIAGVLISFSGVILLSFNSGASPQGELSAAGILLVLGSAFIWASFWILKMKNKNEPVAELFFNFLYGSAYLIILSLFIPMEWPSARGLAAAVYSGTFEMGFTFIIWLKALHLATNKVVLTQITYLSPLLSLVLIHFVLGENISYITVAGLLLITGGIILGNARMKQSLKFRT